MKLNIIKLKKVSFFILVIFFAFGPQITCAVNLPISSHFGWRTHPIANETRFHAGLDLAYDYGTPIPAMLRGTVVFAGSYGGLGNAVYIYHHDSNTYTGYAHCQSVTVNVGQYVNQGHIIAHVGSTGYSTGPHLHLEYIVPDGKGGWIYTDPLNLWK